MSRYAFVSTPVLDIAYLEWNPRGQQVAVLVHGWPDCAESWAVTCWISSTHYASTSRCWSATTGAHGRWPMPAGCAITPPHGW